MRGYLRLPIDGMTCASCASRITRAVRKVDGVESVKVDLGSDSADVVFDSSRTSLAAIGGAIRRAGYEVDPERAEPFVPAVGRGFLSRLTQRRSGRISGS
jgi:copper ion binding protein